MIIEFYDVSNISESFEQQDNVNNISQVTDYDDLDKQQHNFIGRTEIKVDKVLQNLMVMGGEYETFRNIVHREGDEQGGIDDELYSSHS